MSISINRRVLLKGSGLALAGTILPHMPEAAVTSGSPQAIHLNLNENAWGASPKVTAALHRELPRLSRYADAALAEPFLEQIAAYERVPADQIVPGEILVALGLWLGSQGGPGREFLYSVPGYTALIDAAARVGGIGVPVPLNSHLENDLPALKERVGAKTRALYLINPHNPSGTVTPIQDFRSFLESVSGHALAIVDEAYLEYTSDFEQRSVVSLVRDGANVLVFRTFDKIHGLAGLPIGYAIAPRALSAVLRKEGLGDFESLGRLNIVAASAALDDANHTTRLRANVAVERAKWIRVLNELRLPHTDARASFVFFDAGASRNQIADVFDRHEIKIGRPFPPLQSWIRITIGLPAENLSAQQVLRQTLASS